MWCVLLVYLLFICWFISCWQYTQSCNSPYRFFHPYSLIAWYCVGTFFCCHRCPVLSYSSATYYFVVLWRIVSTWDRSNPVDRSSIRIKCSWSADLSWVITFFWILSCGLVSAESLGGCLSSFWNWGDSWSFESQNCTYVPLRFRYAGSLDFRLLLWFIFRCTSLVPCRCCCCCCWNSDIFWVGIVWRTKFIKVYSWFLEGFHFGLN